MKLNPVSAQKIIKALSKLGFKTVRQKGSHVILKNSENRMIIVPVHPSEEISGGLLRKIINESKLTVEEFQKLLEKV